MEKEERHVEHGECHRSGSNEHGMVCDVRGWIYHMRTVRNGGYEELRLLVKEKSIYIGSARSEC